MDIKEKDLFEVDRVNMNFPRFYNQVILGQNEVSDHFKRVKGLSNLVKYFYLIFQ